MTTIIPIKCPNCGFPVADLYDYFTAEVRKRKLAKGIAPNAIQYLSKDRAEKTIEGVVLDELHLDPKIHPCCRTLLLTHVDNN